MNKIISRLSLSVGLMLILYFASPPSDTMQTQDWLLFMVGLICFWIYGLFPNEN